MTRSELIKVTLTPEEKRAIKAAADAEGLDMSAYVRMAALRMVRQ